MVRAARRSGAAADHRDPHAERSRRSRSTGVAFAVRSHASAPPDIVRLDVKKPATLTQLTELNADLMAGTRVGDVEEIWYTSSGGRPGPGLDRQAALLQSRPEVSADPGDPRRPARELQRRLQLDVPELRRQRIRGALHQSARQHRVRFRVRQRDQACLSERGLRRPDGGRRFGGGPRLHRHQEHVRGRLLAAAACCRAG